MIAPAPNKVRSVDEITFHPRPLWQPTIWVGCDLFAWLRLLAQSLSHLLGVPAHRRLRHGRGLFPYAAPRRAMADLRTRRRPNSTTRSSDLHRRALAPGTTLLHELLALDERHAFPTTYECMEPNHFLLTENLFTRWLPFFAPSKRPMDNMAAGFSRPQEDEFALCMLGQPSPYLSVAFPNESSKYDEYLDLETLAPPALDSWKGTFSRFLTELTFTHKKRLILKSPTHSYRIKVLLEMFPNARFIHIVRNPYVVYPSTVNLWKSLYRAFALVQPTSQGLKHRVLRNFVHLYNKIEEGKSLVDFDRFYELRYEDLVRDPVGQMGTLTTISGSASSRNCFPSCRNTSETTEATRRTAIDSPKRT